MNCDRYLFRLRNVLFVLCGLLACFSETVGATNSATAADWSFELSFDKKVHSQPYTGRVYVMFDRSYKEPRRTSSWFFAKPVISLHVVNWKPGETLTVSTKTIATKKVGSLRSYPKNFSKLNLTGYYAQAMVRFNPVVPKIGSGVGNGFSASVQLKENKKPISLTVNQLVPAKKFTETKWVKLLRMKSPLLSKFHKRDTFLRASVHLPASYYDKPQKRYPTIFSIPGFGGTHKSRRSKNGPVTETNRQKVEFIRVHLDPSCARGHHVFADSANNGPVGKSLITELIPAFDKKFRTVPQAAGRFLTGHSSGGWSSLWLQVTYPKTFGGTWSTAPDPVDFHDFQQIDLYKAGENMYVDSAGKKRPLGRMRGTIFLWFQLFAEAEWALGHGGQLHSFEAVFSPSYLDKNKQCKPVLLWDRKTGKIDPAVVKHWKKYDIRLILEQNWATLAPKLKGKLHVFMGEKDNFYLEGAAKRLKQSLKKLNSDAVVELFPGKDHMTLLSPALRKRISQEMADTFLAKTAPAKKTTVEKTGKKQANFLFILIDDLGHNDVGYHGSTFHETPNIDRFAASAMRFDWSYAASPMCSPTRASILTGKSPARTGLTQYLKGWRSSRFKVITPLTTNQMARKEVTLGETFKAAGYNTAFMGKWHLGSFTLDDPKRRGFDVTTAVIEGNRCEMFYPFRGQKYFADQKKGDHFTDKLTDEAVNYLKKQKDAKKPFLLYLSHFAMHAPIASKDKDRAHFAKKAAKLPVLSEEKQGVKEPYAHKGVKARQDDAEYAGELKNLDDNIGRLLKQLDALGLAKDTVVIFTADNGGRTSLWKKFQHPTSVQPLRGGKTFAFEGGIRIPTIIRWPGVTKPKQRCSTPIISMDFYPTMLEMAGLPLKKEQHKDGLSLVPLLNEKTIDRKYLDWHFPHYQGEGSYPASAIRDGQYKLLRNYHFDDHQLFDLKSDPGETKNIIAKHPKIAERLKKELTRRLKACGAKIPYKNPRKDIILDIQEKYRDRPGKPKPKPKPKTKTKPNQ